MSTDQIHPCSYYCARPECIKRQRDELRAKYVKLSDRFDKLLTEYAAQANRAVTNNDFKERLAEAIKQMPFGKDTTDSFAAFVREFK